ncbi:Fe2+-dependent dioxygenase [Novosphingobium profundi]|uniref:Fe2+-dependent dioxygenase n=1 Tax=Novosphingobium profundi TaxID=1774954 RepID=UPI001BDA511B|nr:Fe2+-dependent dioxygenase [Novosphingobium profundi]MBT0671058.1 Fe2+-dependent dioxygenase [Novosphingobium profundi]
MLTVIEHLLDAGEVASLRRELETAQWVDGAQSAGTRSVAVKQNRQVDRDCPKGRALSDTILRKLGACPQFVSASLAEKIWPPVFNCYQDGGHYGTHVDSALMRDNVRGFTLRSDLSATIFLSDPASYEGGELVIEQEFGAQAVKLAAGDMVLYPSSSLHQVTPVTSGQRLCAILWLQSAVPDTAERTLLYDLDQSIQNLAAARDATDPDVDRLIHVYHNLVRRWAQV